MGVSVYGGFQTAPHSDIEVSDGPDFRAGWEGKSFEMPPYYGVRGTWWMTNLGKPNLGLSVDFTHAKVYADFAAEKARVQEMRVAAMRAYAEDVHAGAYPAPQHLVESEAEVVAAFRDWLDQQA